MSMPPFSYCNAREQHVTRTGHTDGDDIVAPGPRAYNPAQLMIVVCVPGIFFGPYCSVICTDTQTIFYHYYCITARHRHLYNPRNPAYFLHCLTKGAFRMSGCSAPGVWEGVAASARRRRWRATCWEGGGGSAGHG